MEVTYTVEGIVLQRQIWREADCRLVIYTREAGKLDLIARGVKKPASKLAGHLEPFNRLKLMVVSGRSRLYVGSARATDTFYHLKQDLDKLEWATKWLAEFNRLVKDNEADTRLYSLLAHSLTIFNSVKADALYYQALYNLYLLKLYELMGEGLDLQMPSKLFSSEQAQKLKTVLADLYLGPPQLTKNLAKLIIALAPTVRN